MRTSVALLPAFILSLILIPSLGGMRTFALSHAALLSSNEAPGVGSSSLDNSVHVPPPQTPVEPAATIFPSSDTSPPVRLSIPSLHLDSSMVPEGVNDKGELEVPDGTTQNVGWYKDGASPGQVGSAVLDAHVFAAFSKLHNIKPGSDIYVVLQNNAQLHFMVQSVSTYELGQVPLEQLFNRADHERLNLITCAGRLTPDHTTYDHRLVIYATLVQ